MHCSKKKSYWITLLTPVVLPVGRAIELTAPSPTIALIGAIVPCTLPAIAQEASRTYRVGMLFPFPRNTGLTATTLAEFFCHQYFDPPLNLKNWKVRVYFADKTGGAQCSIR